MQILLVMEQEMHSSLGQGQFKKTQLSISSLGKCQIRLPVEDYVCT